ncbi:MAG: peptidoglycan DD-metalloendopeptidase family protein, partial [Actinomycetota bacterium]|nr:peptidoglycan DD-metalloendopeptidase family protein [Actinomycetota bacterium]
PPPSEPPPSDPPPSEPPPSEPPPSEPPPSDPPPSDPSPRSDPPPVPPSFSEAIAAASPGREGQAAEATRLSRLVFLIEEQLEQLEVQAKAAADLYRQAESDLIGANARAEQARLNATAADRELRAAQEALEDFARDTYVNASSELAVSMLLLDSNGAADLIERAGLLEAISTSRTEVLDRVVESRARSAAAEQAATVALDANLEAEAQARAVLEQATATLEEQEANLPKLLEDKADNDAKFYEALVELLGPEGAAAAFAQYEQDQANQYGAEAAARAAANGGGPVLSGSWALPLAGPLTSCFCERWGTMHWGIDIAAPMYTPMYSAGDGVVVKAGAATGFGQAVYIEHDNGDVTVYGHMEVIEVSTGQRVAAGQEIALVGSQGFSTGPHLHFEVYAGGLNGVRVDPVLWLANRGIFV